MKKLGNFRLENLAFTKLPYPLAGQFWGPNFTSRITSILIIIPDESKYQRTTSKVLGGSETVNHTMLHPRNGKTRKVGAENVRRLFDFETIRDSQMRTFKKS